MAEHVDHRQKMVEEIDAYLDEAVGGLYLVEPLECAASDAVRSNLTRSSITGTWP